MRAALLLITCSTIASAETPPSLTTPDPVPAVKGAVTRLDVKKRATIAGIEVTFAYASHKRVAAGHGPAPGMWGFELVRRGKKAEIELRHTQSGFEAEVAAHGALLVFRHVGYTRFDIVLAAAKAPKPLDDDQCAERIDQAAAKRKLPIDESSSTGESGGIVEKTTPSWVGYCGTLTRRVWFAPPRPKRGALTP